MLLLDEPLSALDPFLRVQMRAELKRWQQELGLTFVHVTHSQEEAMALADHGGRDEPGPDRAGRLAARGLQRSRRTEFVARFMGGHNVITTPAGRWRCATTACRSCRLRLRVPPAAGAHARPVRASSTRAPMCWPACSAAVPVAETTRMDCDARRCGCPTTHPCWPGDGGLHVPWARATNAHAPGCARAAAHFDPPAHQSEETPDVRQDSVDAAPCSSRAAAGRHARRDPAIRLRAVLRRRRVTLRYLGTAVNQDKAIAEKFKADTGIEIQYVAVTTDDVTKRAVTAPNSFDLIDTEYFSLKKIVPDRQSEGHRHQEDQERRQDHAPCSPRARWAARR